MALHRTSRTNLLHQPPTPTSHTNLQGLAQAHLVRQDGVTLLAPGVDHEVEALQLVLVQLACCDVGRLFLQLLHRQERQNRQLARRLV